MRKDASAAPDRCAEAALKFLDAEIAAERIKVYRSILRKPYISFLDGNVTHNHLYLYDQQVKEQLTNLVWERSEHICLLKRYELERVIMALAGRASVNERGVADPELLSLLETEPVLAVAVEFMESKGADRIEETMEALWKKWSEFARERGLLQFGRRRFPGGSNVLGKKLRQLRAALKELEIDVEIKRNNGSKVVITRRKNGSCDEPSAEPSVAKTPHSMALSTTDDRTALLTQLHERRHQHPQQGAQKQCE